MFGSIGPTELILIFVIALLVFGPKKLPEIGKSVGKALREFKKASDEIKGRIEEEIQASEIKDVHRDIQSGMNSLRDGIRDIGNVSGVNDLKKELASATDLSAPLSSPPAAQVPAPQVPDPYAQPASPAAETSSLPSSGADTTTVPLPTETAPFGTVETAISVDPTMYPPVGMAETPAQGLHEHAGPGAGEVLSSGAKKPGPKSTGRKTAARKPRPQTSSKKRDSEPAARMAAQKHDPGPAPLVKNSGRRPLAKAPGPGKPRKPPKPRKRRN